MISSASIKEVKKFASKYKLRLSPDGLIVYDRTIPCTVRYNHAETEKLAGKKIDFSKWDEVCEVAHLEISNTCNMNCAYCYVQDKKKGFLNTSSWKKIIKNISNAGVFQVSFGGGEPTMRPDLFELAKYVDECGMNLGMTTNGKELHRLDPIALRRYFKQINVSWHENADTVEKALMFLQRFKIPRGINYCFSKQMAKDNDVVKCLAENHQAEILYLVYKPVIKDTKNQIDGESVYKIAKQAANEGLRVAVDGPCVNKCMMKKKFIDVNSFGDVYPCSFVRSPLGNLLKMDLQTIWKNRGEQDECPFVKFNKEGKTSG